MSRAMIPSYESRRSTARRLRRHAVCRRGLADFVGEIVCLLVTIALGWAAYRFVWPEVSDLITRHRLAGLWDISGSLKDWRFGTDGTWREEGLFSVEGRYELLDDRRIRLQASGFTWDYKYEFDDIGLVLIYEKNDTKLRLISKE